MKTKTSYTKETAPNTGLFGELHPRWNPIKAAKVDSTYQRDYLRKVRSATLEALGGYCVHCGFADARALQIDHINGDGSKERKERTYKGSFHAHVLKSFLANENKYQLLCANCNWIKRFEKQEATGRRTK